MSLVDIWVGLGLFIIGWHFYHQRKIAELARDHAAKYCEQNNLQFISIAKIKARLKSQPHRGLIWCNEYQFEFSGDGESAYQGHLTMHGTRLESVDLPVYRI